MIDQFDSHDFAINSLLMAQRLMTQLVTADILSLE